MTKGGGDQGARLRGDLARLRPLNPFEVLGVASTATAEEVRGAFLTATKRHHPVLFGRDSAEIQDLATEVFLVIRRAYGVLSDDSKRRALRDKIGTPSDRVGPVPTGPVGPGVPMPPSAPSAAMESRSLTPPVGMPALAPSVTSPAPTSSHVPATPSPRRGAAPPPSARQTSSARAPAPRVGSTTDVQGILDAAKIRAGRFDDTGRLMIQKRFTEAREMLQKIVIEDPQNRRYRTRLHLAWGLEYREQRKLDEAVRELERAVSLDPENAEVVEVLRKTRELRESSRGIMSKLFGR